jgi:hypothetical protein
MFDYNGPNLRLALPQRRDHAELRYAVSAFYVTVPADGADYGCDSILFKN